MVTARQIRILLIDDHPLVRDGIRKLIEREPDLLVAGEAASEQEAGRIVVEVAADVALVDVSLPGEGGVKLTEAIVSRAPTIRVIGVTRHTDRAFATKMLQAGAWGYVLKQNISSELLRAIRVVAAGDRFIDPVLRSEIETVGPTRDRKGLVHTHEPLTDKEEQVLRLVAAAYSNQDIAVRLGAPLDEIVALKGSGMKKAGLTSRVQLVAYAEERGWRN